MKIQELSKRELKYINGGASFAYRVGQLIRFAFKATSPAGYTEFITEVIVNEVMSE